MFKRACSLFDKHLESFEALNSDSIRYLETLEQILASIETDPKTYDPRELLRSYLKKLGLKVDPRLFFNLGPSDEFEIWSADHKFLGSSGAFFRMSSYTLPELLQGQRDQLFHRDPENNARIFGAIGQIMKGETIVNDVTPWHLVYETGRAHVSVLAKVKTVALAMSASTSAPIGFIAVVNFKKLDEQAASLDQ